MIKIKYGNISYTKNDTFLIRVFPKYEGVFEEGMQLRFIIAENEGDTAIIDEVFNIDKDLTFTITLSSTNKAKLNYGDYLYKMILIKNNTVITKKSGNFEVKWGA